MYNNVSPNREITVFVRYPKHGKLKKVIYQEKHFLGNEPKILKTRQDLKEGRKVDQKDIEVAYRRYDSEQNTEHNLHLETDINCIMSEDRDLRNINENGKEELGKENMEGEEKSNNLSKIAEKRSLFLSTSDIKLTPKTPLGPKNLNN